MNKPFFFEYSLSKESHFWIRLSSCEDFSLEMMADQAAKDLFDSEPFEEREIFIRVNGKLYKAQVDVDCDPIFNANVEEVKS